VFPVLSNLLESLVADVHHAYNNSSSSRRLRKSMTGPNRVRKTQYFRGVNWLNRPTWNKRLVFSRVRDIREIGRICPYLSRRSNVPRDHRKNTGRGESFDRRTVVGISKKRGAARWRYFIARQSAVRRVAGARYGFRHIIRDFFRIPGEIDGICWRVFGGTSERISVDLDRAPRTRHNVWMTGEPAGLGTRVPCVSSSFQSSW